MGFIGCFTHRPLSSSFLGLPYGIRNINHKKEPLRGLWVEFRGFRGLGLRGLRVQGFRGFIWFIGFIGFRGLKV